MFHGLVEEVAFLTARRGSPLLFSRPPPKRTPPSGGGSEESGTLTGTQAIQMR